MYAAGQRAAAQAAVLGGVLYCAQSLVAHIQGCCLVYASRPFGEHPVVKLLFQDQKPSVQDCPLIGSQSARWQVCDCQCSDKGFSGVVHENVAVSWPFDWESRNHRIRPHQHV